MIDIDSSEFLKHGWEVSEQLQSGFGRTAASEQSIL